MGCFCKWGVLDRQRHTVPLSSLSLLRVSCAPLVYFEVVLSQLLYLWWQPVQAPRHSSFSHSGPWSW